MVVQSKSVLRPAQVPDRVQDPSAETRLVISGRASATVIRDNAVDNIPKCAAFSRKKSFSGTTAADMVCLLHGMTARPRV